MATVEFYEKAGCINNTRQKNMLRQAGHYLVERDLRQVCWTQESLLEFFSALPVAEWFNNSAPSIKTGELDPAQCSVEQALGLMIDNPLLIRRPLMRVNNEVMVGFDQARVDKWIGLRAKTADDLETCPRQQAGGASISDIRSKCL